MMSDEFSKSHDEGPDGTTDQSQFVMGSTVRWIGRISAALGSTAVVALTLIMLAETTARYLFNSPLGWNVSLVENLLMPASVFLALPWLYVCAGQVSAGLVYTRMSPASQLVARAVTFAIIMLMAVLLLVAGFEATADSFALGEFPSPVSNDIPIPTWMWLSLQPLGAAGLIIVVLLDAPRFLRHGEPESEIEA